MCSDTHAFEPLQTSVRGLPWIFLIHESINFKVLLEITVTLLDFTDDLCTCMKSFAGLLFSCFFFFFSHSNVKGKKYTQDRE